MVWICAVAYVFGIHAKHVVLVWEGVNEQIVRMGLNEGNWMADVWVSDAFNKKMAAFQNAELGDVCVVSDWDRTLTYPKTANGQDTTSYLAIVHGGYLGDGYRDEMAKLYVKYRGAELDSSICEADKLRLMDEWWMAALGLLEDYGLTRAMLEDVSKQDVMVLRKGVVDFLRMLNEKHTPLQIVSAGLGDVIVSFLEARSLMLNNMHLIANWLQFDGEGRVIGCKKPVIHSANKTHLIDVQSLGKTCVLLLGDTLEDAEMVPDFEGGTVLRVGFLNDETEEKRQEFAQVYDMVIGGNGDFEPVNALVNAWA